MNTRECADCRRVYPHTSTFFAMYNGREDKLCKICRNISRNKARGKPSVTDERIVPGASWTDGKGEFVVTGCFGASIYHGIRVYVRNVKTFRSTTMSARDFLKKFTPMVSEAAE